MKFDLSKIQSASDLNKRISKIAKVGSALQNEIHEVAVQSLAHIVAHGDYTIAVRLVNSLPNGVRRQALVAWDTKFSGGQLKFSYDKNAQAFSAKLVKDWKAENFDLDGAEAVTFGDYLPEKGYSTLTFDGFLAYLKRQGNQKGMNPNGTPKVEPSVRELCADLYARLSTPKQKADVIPLAALIVDSDQ